MSKIERSYFNVAYWAPFLSEEDMELSRELLYLFIMDVGMFPFEKCYEGRTIMSGCVTARNVSLLRELLKHEYCVHYKDDFDFAKRRCKSKDAVGNNLMHHVFMLPDSIRNLFFDVINEFPVTIVYQPGENDGLFKKFQVNPDYLGEPTYV